MNLPKLIPAFATAFASSFADKASQYLDELAVPVGTILAALAIGILFERLALRFLYRFFEKRGFIIGRRLIRSFNGIITIWFGLAAFRAVVDDLPLQGSAVPTVMRIASGIFFVSLAVLTSRVVIAFIRTFSSRHERALPSITLFENIVRAVIYALGILSILRLFGVAVTPLLTALGVGGLAVALALQDTLGNFFAGVYIIVSKYIDPGDFVRLDGGQEGVIVDIAWRVTTIRTPLDTLIIVPNSKFAASILTNFDHPDRKLKLFVELPLDPKADATAFRDRVMTVAQELQARMPDVIVAPPIVRFTGVTATGPVLTLVMAINDYARGPELRSIVIEQLLATGYPFPPLPRVA